MWFKKALNHGVIFLKNAIELNQSSARHCSYVVRNAKMDGHGTNRQLLLISSSAVHNYEYLECASDDINSLLKKNNVSTVLFVPYALKAHDKYLEKVQSAMCKWGYKVEGIHNFEDAVHAVQKAEAIFIGGGNTFLLLKTLYDKNLVQTIRKRVMQDGIPYIGSSAGTNVATRSIHTTNDMPIVYPPSFEALKLVPFNINPHYIDPDLKSTHKGETREERIQQFLEQPENAAVLGLREGCSLIVDKNQAKLSGIHNARVFMPGKEAQEFKPGSDLSFLLNDNPNL